MVAKDKNDFLFQLHNELHRIGVDDVEDIFADFEEHFKASQNEGFTEEQTCEKLGDVKEIARNYIDIESSKINSIVANAIEENRPHVSLTKPGRDIPADISLRKPEPAAEAVQTAPAQESVSEQPAIREYTPEHIAEEPIPDRVSVPNVNLVKPEEPVSEPVREVTPQHIAPETPAQEAPKQNAEQPAADTSAANAEFSNAHKSDIPPQSCEQVGSGKGFQWKDLKNQKPNVNVGKLIVQLALDIFIYVWALPALASVILTYITSVAFGTLGTGFSVFFGGAFGFHILSSIFLGVGLISGGILLIMLGIQMIKGFIHIIKSIVIAHVKAIYDL